MINLFEHAIFSFRILLWILVQNKQVPVLSSFQHHIERWADWGIQCHHSSLDTRCPMRIQQLQPLWPWKVEETVQRSTHPVPRPSLTPAKKVTIHADVNSGQTKPLGICFVLVLGIISHQKGREREREGDRWKQKGRSGSFRYMLMPFLCPPKYFGISVRVDGLPSCFIFFFLLLRSIFSCFQSVSFSVATPGPFPLHGQVHLKEWTGSKIFHTPRIWWQTSWPLHCWPCRLGSTRSFATDFGVTGSCQSCQFCQFLLYTDSNKLFWLKIDEDCALVASNSQSLTSKNNDVWN